MRVIDLYDEGGLKLNLVAGEQGLKRLIEKAGVHRPGLPLTGYLRGYDPNCILVFGQAEIAYLNDLDPEVRKSRLDVVISRKIPAVFVGKSLVPPIELIDLCESFGIALFCSPLKTASLISTLNILLVDAFAPTLTCHGSFVEVHGVGLLMQGESAIGKSEAALSLVDRGHRLVADDIVRVKKREGEYLEGSGMELSQGHIELRGIGILNLAHLYGVGSICHKKKLDLVVKLEVWDDTQFYDRSGLFDDAIEILGVEVPYHVLPVKPGRDIALLIETLALNHRLKVQGKNAAQEFEAKLMQVMNENGNCSKNSC